MKTNFEKRRAKYYKILSRFSYDEMDQKTNKICRDTETGEYVSYLQLSKWLHLSERQTIRLVKQFKDIKTEEDKQKFLNHGSVRNPKPLE